VTPKNVRALFFNFSTPKQWDWEARLGISFFNKSKISNSRRAHTVAYPTWSGVIKTSYFRKFVHGCKKFYTRNFLFLNCGNPVRLENSSRAMLRPLPGSSAVQSSKVFRTSPAWRLARAEGQKRNPDGKFLVRFGERTSLNFCIPG
jgi:hypothetical protein